LIKGFPTTTTTTTTTTKQNVDPAVHFVYSRVKNDNPICGQGNLRIPRTPRITRTSSKSLTVTNPYFTLFSI
jgi:hypothetical protein